MATYNVHAGHCPQGKGASGACGYLKESVEDRLVKDALIAKLKSAGHTVYDCTDNSNCTASQNLKNIVTKCNAHRVDLDISIHLNAGGGTGVETLIYNEKTKAIATKISQEISSVLGITNRGVKTRTGLYVLRHTNAPALLVECCFVDSQNDYNKWNVEKCAEVSQGNLLLMLKKKDGKRMIQAGGINIQMVLIQKMVGRKLMVIGTTLMVTDICTKKVGIR